MRAWWRSVLMVSLAAAAVCAGPGRAESGNTRVDREMLDGKPVLAMDLVVFFDGIPADPAEAQEVMLKYKPTFNNLARSLYDAMEGEIYIRRIEFTNRPERQVEADIVYRSKRVRPSDGAVADRNGFDQGKDSEIELTLERHICESDDAAARAATFDQLLFTRQVPVTNRDGSVDVQTWEYRSECEQGYRASFGILHELGHYLFGLQEEYDGRVWSNCNTSSRFNCSLSDQCRIETKCDDPDLTADERAECERTLGTDVPEQESTPYVLEPKRTGEANGAVQVYTFSPVSSDLLEIVLKLDPKQVQIGQQTFQSSVKDTVLFEVIAPGLGSAPLTEQTSPRVTFQDNFDSLVWSIRDAQGSAPYEVRIASRVEGADQMVVAAYRIDQPCRFSCSSDSANNPGCRANASSSSRACVMDGGTTTLLRNTRTEWCVIHNAVAGEGVRHALGEDTFNGGCEIARFATFQEYYNGCSCWESIAGSRFRKRFALGRTDNFDAPVTYAEEMANEPWGSLLQATVPVLDATTGAPVLDPDTGKVQRRPRVLARESQVLTRLPEISVDPAVPAANPLAMTAGDTTVTGPPGFVFALDASGSMAQFSGEKDLDGKDLTRFDIAINAVMDAVNLVKDEERMGVLTIGAADEVAWVPRNFFTGEDVEDARKDYFINTGARLREDFINDAQPGPNRAAVLSTGTRTALGEGLKLARESLEPFRGEEMSNKVIFLVSDGRSNSGTSLEDEVRKLADSPRFTVHTVGFGPQADLKALEDIANQTGGQFFYAGDSDDLRGLVPRLVATARAEEEIFKQWFDIEGGIAGGAVIQTEIDVSPFVDEITFV
ncbi:MAG: VWA domain-containing protein, partial [Planctomycetota bacterium]|nr:VWA domain-containing protein [Planctomycetota bacterium]